MMSTALSRKSEATAPALSRFPWGRFGELPGAGLILLDLFALGSAAWNLRQTFDEALRELGPQAEGWIAARGRTEAEKCAWFRATVYGSTPRRTGLSRRSRFLWPVNQTHAMPPLAAKTFVRNFLEELILLRFKESGS
jgi:hypothetical protein